MQYRTIRAAASAEFVEKRSRFIGYISPVTAQQDAIAFIDSIYLLQRKEQITARGCLVRPNLYHNSAAAYQL